MSKQGKVLLAGATGLVGKHCLQALLNLNVHQAIHVLLRRESDLGLTEEQKSRVHFHLIDFDDMEQHAELFAQADQVISCLGTTLKQAGSLAAFEKVDYDYCYQLGKLAKDAGVGHFLIVTAVNAKANSLAYYSKTKGRLQNDLKVLGFDRLSIFQPSLLLGEREQFRLGEALFGKLFGVMNILIPQKMSAYQAIQGKVVGRAMAQLAASESLAKGHGTQYYHHDEMQALSKIVVKED